MAPSDQSGAVHGVRDQARGGTEISDRFEQAGLAELPREILRVRGWRRGDELIDAPSHVVHDVKLAGVVFIECDDSVVRLRDLLMPEDLLTVVSECPDLAGIVVPVDVGADEVFQPRAAIDIAAGDRPRLGVGVLDDRRQDGGGALLPVRLIRVVPLPDIPAVVPPAPDQINQLPEILADVTGPEVSGNAVDAESPGIPQSVGPDLRPGPGEADERVVGRDRVRSISLRMVDVDPHDGTRQIAQPLPIVGAAAVARRDVEVAVAAEYQTAAVVIQRRPLDEDEFRFRVGARRFALVDLEPGYPHGPGLCVRGHGEACDEHIAVLLEPGVQGQTEHFFFHVEDEFVFFDRRVVWKREEFAEPLKQVDAVRPGRVRHGDRLVELQFGESRFGVKRRGGVGTPLDPRGGPKDSLFEPVGPLRVGRFVRGRRRAYERGRGWQGQERKPNEQA